MRVNGESKDGETDLDLQVVNGARQDARYTLTFGAPGRYDVLVDFNKIQHRFGNDAHMLWTRTGAGTLEIPDATQLALQGLQNYLPGALLLNASNGSYSAKVYGVSFSLFF
jgi:hypothetical protein